LKEVVAMTFIRSGLVLAVLLAASSALAVGAEISDAQVRKAIIQETLQSYPGRCPCPYNVDRAGRSCGRRSAYSRPGGYAPICYDGDVTEQMIRAWRARH
jgi:hypothetical protein